MQTNTIATEKDTEPPAGHPAFACESPLEPSSIKPPPARYYQQHPPTKAAAETPINTTNTTTTTTTTTTTDAEEFDFRRTDPEHVKVEPTIIDKMKEVLHLHKRH